MSDEDDGVAPFEIYSVWLVQVIATAGKTGSHWLQL